MKQLLTALAAFAAIAASAARAQADDADARARATEARMTEEERFSLVWGYMPVASRKGPAPTPPHIKPMAGYFPPIERLGFPGLYETDASLGITNPKMSREGDVATALPSGLALAATFDPQLAYNSGVMIAAEARAKGFNVLLAGGVNLTRDWFGGRNFEYLGEDPLLAGIMAGESIRGIQSQRVVSTAKHFVLNSQETLRHSLNAQITEAELRESDLLAFQIAHERGRPGAIMCAYNKINAVYGCSNDWLLNKVLRRDWGFKGWVMSDWGATHGPEDMLAGLDQQSGAQLDAQVWFDKPLRAALGTTIPREALSTSVRRILRAVYAVGADEPLAESAIDYALNADVSHKAAAAGIVLLKNDGVLPLANAARKILVVGRYADRGVWTGGGSSQVIPVGGAGLRMPFGGSGFLNVNGYQVLIGSSPLDELRLQLKDAQIEFDTGYSPELAAARAAHADLVIVFVNQWQVESLDHASLALPEGQDRMVDAIATANPNAIVVLETGNPIGMPWLGKVRAVVQAWYSGQKGATAIADVLTGKVNPSGRLPITFPAAAEHAPRAKPIGLGLPDDGTHELTADYREGSDVGYRWYARQALKPLFAFGHGLSYTRFEHGPLSLSGGRKVSARILVRNAGARAGADVPQLYLVGRNGQPMRRLAGFGKADLKPGEARELTIDVDPRILAEWTGEGWTVAAGTYEFAIGRSAEELGPAVPITLRKQRIAP